MTPEVQERIAQLRRGEVPEGYKKTKQGIRPFEWKSYTVGDCLCRVGEPVKVEPEKLYTQIGIRSHGKGLFYKEPVTGESLGNKAVFWIEPDCFVVNIVFAWEQAIGKTTANEVGMIGSHRFPMYHPIDNLVDIDYLISYFLTKRGADILEAASPGGAGRNKTLGQDRFLNSKIILPSIAEQQRIAAILTTQDKLIELKERLLKEKKQQKKYLMQQLLTGKKRLPGFDEKWNKTNLAKISKKQNRKNNDFLVTEVFSNSAQLGIVPQEDQFDKDIANADRIDGYYIVEDGMFIYNPRISNSAPCGPISQNKLGRTGVMSPLYTVFAVQSPVINVAFLDHYFQSTCWHQYMKSIANYGARHDRMAVSNEDFFAMPIPVPAKDEQAAIAEVLSTSDHEIDLHQQSLDAEKQKKKALMQLLLTGIVRACNEPV